MPSKPHPSRRVAPPLLAAALALLPGCGAAGIRFQSPIAFGSSEKPIGPGKLTPAAIQSEVMSFTDTFNAAVAQQWNRVAAEGRASSDPRGLAKPGSDAERANRLRRSALESKLATVTAALTIASSPSPTVALADMITMVTLQRMVLETPAPAALYGPELISGLVGTFREQEAKLWRIADGAFTPEQRDELRTLIAEWRAAHPDDTYVANVRLEDFARGRQVSVASDKASGSLLAIVALDPLAGIDPAQREVQQSRLLAERVFFYASRSPQVLKWQVESLYQSLLSAPEARQVLANLDEATAATDRITTVAERLSSDISAERAALLDDLAAKVSEQRTAAIAEIDAAVTGQREALIDDLDDAGAKLQPTLAGLRETADSAARAAQAITATVHAADAFTARIDPPDDPANPKDPDKDAIADFRLAMAETGAAADRVALLTRDLDRFLASPAIGNGSDAVQTAVDKSTAGIKDVIDYAFIRLLVLGVAIPVAIGLAAGLYRRLGRR